jgi:tetratricopeptide (TPR) repeat protein
MSITTLVLTLGLTLAPATQDAGVDQAAQLFEEGRLDEAATRLQALLASGDGDAREIRLLLAEVQVASGDAPAAIETLDALGMPNDHDVCLATGGAYVAWADQLAAQGSSEEDVRMALIDARGQLENAASLAPNGDARARLQLGYLELYRLGEHEKVIGMADEVLALSPGDGEMLLLRGCAGVFRYWNAKQGGDDSAAQAEAAWRRSVEDLQAAAEALPRDRVEPWGQLIWLNEDAGQAMAAVDAAITLLERAPDSSFDTLYRLAVRYSYERRFDAAGRAMEAMVNLSAREITARLMREENLDDVATQLGWSIDPFASNNDNATARSILAAIIAAEPTNPILWDNYAVMCQLTSRPEDAVRAYEHLLTYDYVDPRVYNDLGAVLQFDLERDLDRARELYRKCISQAEIELAPRLVPEDRQEHLREAIRIAEGNLRGNDSRGLIGGLADLLGGLANAAGEAAGDGEGAGDGEAGQSEGGETDG